MTNDKTPKTYLVVNYETGHVLDRQPNYHLALASYQAAQKVAPLTADKLAVRYADDPKWAAAKDAPYSEYPETMAREMYWATVKLAKNELGTTARWAIKHHGDLWFDQLVNLVVKSMREREFPVERWQAERAVKDRVSIGRSSVTGKGYWFPKQKGRTLSTERGPLGEREWLNQSSLALKAGFASLDAAKRAHEHDRREFFEEARR